MNGQRNNDPFEREDWPSFPPDDNSTLRGRQARDRGQMTILFAVMATALFAFLALTIDGGFAFSHRRMMQNAADAGSLAGTRQLANYDAGTTVSDNDVYQAVVRAATSNGWNASTGAIMASYITTQRVPVGVVGTGTTAPPAAARGVYVKAGTEYATFFGGFIGVDRLTSEAEARSIFGYSCTAECLTPIAVYTQTFTSDTDYNFYGASAGPGQFSWVEFSCGSNSCLCDDLNVNSCASGQLEVYDWIGGSSGDNWGGCGAGQDVETRLRALIGKTVLIPVFGPGPGQPPGPGNPGCEDGTPAKTNCNSGTCYATCGTGGNLMYHIVGFAALLITGVDGSTKSVTGEFKEMVTDAELKPGCTSDTGVRAINLIR